MRFFDRLSRGWHLGITSLEVIKDHPKLLLFPVLSGAALIAILVSFAGAMFSLAGFSPEALEAAMRSLEQTGDVGVFIGLFLFYLISFFVVIFFNVALVYNAKQIFAGEEPSIRGGLQFAASRIVNIFAWAVLAATVGAILRMLEERLGWIGQIVVGLIGMAWSITTYFVVPVLTYENVGPIDALKRSTQTIKEKWGESLGAGFSFGLFFLAGMALAVIGGLIVGQVNAVAGVMVGFATFMLTIVVNSAARNVFLAAAYEHTQGHTPEQFDGKTLDGIFIEKRK